jgi:hypothetical protein
MALICRDDLPDGHSEKFWRQDWTGKSLLKFQEKLAGTRHGPDAPFCRQPKRKRLGLLERHDAERPTIRQNAAIESVPEPLDTAALSAERLSQSCMERSWI